MISPSHSHASAQPALLALVGATAEWQVGIAPHCLATVRLLHDVDFTVHGGECVVVHHEEPASVRVLLAALSGHPRLIAGGVLRGARVASPGVRVRRGSIRRDLVAPIVAGWSAARAAVGALPPMPSPRPRTVHLLRASRAAPLGGLRSNRSDHAPVATALASGPHEHARDHEAWRAWALQQRRLGGAIVIVADTRDDATAGVRTQPSPARGPTTARLGVHEMPPSYGIHSRDVRECVLRNGRLLSRASTVPPDDPFDQSCWPSEAPLVVGP